MSNKQAWSAEGFVPPAPDAEDYPYDVPPKVGDVVLIQIDTDGPELPATVLYLEPGTETQPVLRLFVMTFTGFELPALGVHYGHKRGFWHHRPED